MIPRTLVPRNVRPLTDEERKRPAARVTTYMDDRTVVPPELSDASPLDGKTSIPAYMPLDVLTTPTLVPRGMAVKQFENIARPADYTTTLESRMVVPVHVEPLAPGEIKELQKAPELTEELRDVIEPDIFITGDANLLIEQKTKNDPKSDLITRVGSVAVHIVLILFLIFSPKIFPAHVPTEEDVNLARQQLSFIYVPSETPAPPTPPQPKIHVDPKVLNRVAPPRVEVQPPAPQPSPERTPSDLPAAPTPHVPVNAQPQPQPTQPSQPLPPSHLESILPPAPQTPNKLNLDLPQASPGKSIQDQVTDAIHRGNHNVYSGGGIQAPGQGGPGMGDGAQILSDTQGVDFSSYIQRLLATLKRNWYAVMPQSAFLGDRGITATTFKVYANGSVVAPDPRLERTSGKEPLDNAAMAAIHASNPFEPLPSQFHGPYLELRIWFLYNIPPDQVGLQ